MECILRTSCGEMASVELVSNLAVRFVMSFWHKHPSRRSHSREVMHAFKRLYTFRMNMVDHGVLSLILYFILQAVACQ